METNGICWVEYSLIEYDLGKDDAVIGPGAKFQWTSPRQSYLSSGHLQASGFAQTVACDTTHTCDKTQGRESQPHQSQDDPAQSNLVIECPIFLHGRMKSSLHGTHF